MLLPKNVLIHIHLKVVLIFLVLNMLLDKQIVLLFAMKNWHNKKAFTSMYVNNVYSYVLKCLIIYQVKRNNMCMYKMKR